MLKTCILFSCGLKKLLECVEEGDDQELTCLEFLEQGESSVVLNEKTCKKYVLL